MKIVRDFESLKGARKFARLLRKKGVPSHSGFFKGNNTHEYGGGSRTYGVWVLVDSQHEDAVNLIENKSYKVKRPLSKSEMAALEERMSRDSKNKVYLEAAIFIIVVGAGTILTVIAYLD